jgi:hypothetical protein
MILAMTMAAALGAGDMNTNGKQLDTALGELAWTVGACQAAMPRLEADTVVLQMTGANIDSPTEEQRRNRALFSGLFVEGSSSRNARSLNATDCSRMLSDVTAALHRAWKGETVL